jgi:hypothetical protein
MYHLPRPVFFEKLIDRIHLTSNKISFPVSGTEDCDACGDQDRYATDVRPFQWAAVCARMSRRGSRKPRPLGWGSSQAKHRINRWIAANESPNFLKCAKADED